MDIAHIPVFFLLLFVLLCQNIYSQDINRLKQGNERFVSESTFHKDFAKERKELISGQKPYAIILTCSDSRVPPELIFDESLGKLFVIRVAGNVVNPDILGSIEYAIEHLHSHLLIYMGHESCGAVKATMEGGKVPPNIGAIAYKIKPAVKKAKQKHLHNENEVLDEAIKINVRNQIETSLKSSNIIKEAFEKGELKIYSAYYNLHSGKVDFEEYNEK
ncbi:MAG TPA: carbonic anhydrase [Bacteroidota bacterium]|nr:carbonic anhydrase [Bacteroidota bacterium]